MVGPGGSATSGDPETWAAQGTRGSGDPEIRTIPGIRRSGDPEIRTIPGIRRSGDPDNSGNPEIRRSGQFRGSGDPEIRGSGDPDNSGDPEIRRSGQFRGSGDPEIPPSTGDPGSCTILACMPTWSTHQPGTQATAQLTLCGRPVNPCTPCNRTIRVDRAPKQLCTQGSLRIRGNRATSHPPPPAALGYPPLPGYQAAGEGGSS